MARPANPNLRQAVVDAATAVFAERGLAAARVSDITELAGVSKGAFYMFFDSKEAAYVAIAQAFLADVLRHLARFEETMCCTEFGPQQLDAAARLDAEFADFLWAHRRPLAMVLEGAMGTPCAYVADEFVDSILEHMRAAMTRDVERHPAMHALFDPDFGAMMATGILYMYARRMIRAAEPPDMARQVTRFRRLVMSGALQALAEAGLPLELPVHLAGPRPAQDRAACAETLPLSPEVQP